MSVFRVKIKGAGMFELWYLDPAGDTGCVHWPALLNPGCSFEQ